MVELKDDGFNFGSSEHHSPAITIEQIHASCDALRNINYEIAMNDSSHLSHELIREGKTHVTVLTAGLRQDIETEKIIPVLSDITGESWEIAYHFGRLFGSDVQMLSQYISKGDLRMSKDCLQLIANPLNIFDPPPKYAETGRQILKQHEDILLEGIKDTDYRRIYASLVSLYLDVLYPDNVTADRLTAEISDILHTALLGSHDDRRAVVYFISSLLSHLPGMPPDSHHTGRSLLQSTFGTLYGINTEALCRAWIQTKTNIAGSEHPDFVKQRKIESFLVYQTNLNSIVYLEERQKGSTKNLMDLFGFRVFSRYSTDRLLEQLRELDVAGNYILIGISIEDLKGAFTTISSIIDPLAHTLHSKYPVRIIEYASKAEAFRTALRLKKRHGSHQVPLGILMGHGITSGQEPASGVSLGWSIDNNEGSQFSIEDLTDERMSPVAELFTHSPIIILNSCSTGTKEGIAQRASKRLHAKIIAQAVPTSIKQIDLVMDDTKLRDADAVYVENDAKRVFKDGKPLTI